MKIAVATEGVSEKVTFPNLFSKIANRGASTFLKVTKLNVHPLGTPEVIAKGSKTAVIYAGAASADILVIVLDREVADESPGTIAARVEAAIVRIYTPTFTVRVVLKDRMYENWLIADIDAVAAQPARFTVTPAMKNRVQPNKADTCDALEMLQRAANPKRAYDKVEDSKKIVPRLSVQTVADHSRSFRHFLHVIEDTRYASQCRTP